MSAISSGDVFASVAVSSFSVIEEFYEGTLGLERMQANPGGVGFRCGDGNLFVYVSITAGKNEATVAGWRVEDATAAAAELAEKGVVFERYDMPDVELVGDVHHMNGGAFKNAWFKDPDGNILAIVSGEM
jgi:catechol 2,3-dioxygenase-like lactoylglutathione lyase family enzyme